MAFPSSRRYVAVLAAFALIAVSPGLESYRLFAQTVRTVPIRSGMTSLPGSSGPNRLSVPSGLGSLRSGLAPAGLAPAIPGSAPMVLPSGPVLLEAAPRVAVPGSSMLFKAVSAAEAAPTLLNKDLPADGAKDGAGVPFQGRALPGGSPVESLQGPIPGAPSFLAAPGGDYSPEGSSSGDSLFKAFVAGVAGRVKPGQILTIEAREEIFSDLGVDQRAGDRLVERMVESGRLAVLLNGTVLRTEAGPRAAATADNVVFKEINRIAAKGLKLLNETRSEAPAGRVSLAAQALHYLNRSAELMIRMKAETGREAPGRGDVEVLRDNAALNYLDSMLQLQDEQFGRGSMDAYEAERAQTVRQWLRNAFYTSEGEPAPLAEEGAEYVSRFLGRLDPDRYNRSSHDSAEIISGMKAGREFFSFLGPSSPRSIPGGDGRTGRELALRPEGGDGGGYPLIASDDRRYSALNEYGVNLTAQAAEGLLPPFIGRTKEIRQMVKTLLRVEKNNPLVVGEKGVGKTAVVRGMAKLMVEGKLPQLHGKNIIQLDLTKLVAGTKYRGEFEERLQKIIEETRKSKGQVILFIDEIHTLLGLGGAEGASDASQALKNALSNGDVSLIGATTLAEFRAIEKDGALARRFNAVKLEAPSKEEAYQILMGAKGRYEAKHKVSIPEETVKAAVDMGARYVTDRNLPDSALDLMDDAAAEVELKASEAAEGGTKKSSDGFLAAVPVVSPEDVSFEIALRTGIPAGKVTSDDLDLLRTLPEELKKKLVGQDEAVDGVVRAIRRGRLGYKEAKQPVGVFVALGPTGVGKTELARVLAGHLFRSEKSMVRIDMSEYQDKSAVSRLIGANPGFVGYEDAGQLTEPVRRNPHTVILLDEIEKAAPEVLDLLLQVVEDGRLTDSQGRTVDFSNTVIILTSNKGGSVSKAPAPAGSTPEQLAKRQADRQTHYLNAFKGAVRPEFFNRIGKRRVIVFNELGRDQLEEILGIQVAELNKRLKAKEMTVTLTDEAKKALVDQATTVENLVYGARPLKQAIENDLEDALVSAELKGTIKAGDKVEADHDGKGFVIRPERPGTFRATMGGGAWLGAIPGLAALLGWLPAWWIVPAVVLAGGGLAYLIRKHYRTHGGFLPNSQAPPAAGSHSLKKWLPTVAGMSVLFLLLDWGSKYLFVSLGIPFVYHFLEPGRLLVMAIAIPLNVLAAGYFLSLAHSEKPPLQALLNFRNKHPLLGWPLYILLSILTFPVGLGEKRYAGDLPRKYPVVGKVLALAGILSAGLAAAALGNGLEGLLNGKVVDFIPFGHGRMNFSDAYIFLGMPLLWMALDFIGKARKSDQTGEPLHLKTWKYWVLPILGLVGFFYSTSMGYELVPPPAWYVLIFSTLFGVGVLIGNAVISRFVAIFNAAFRRSPAAAPAPSSKAAEARDWARTGLH